MQTQWLNELSAMQVEFLPAAAMSEEDLERQRQVAAELAKRTRWVDFEYDGQPAQASSSVLSLSLPLHHYQDTPSIHKSSLQP